MLRTMSRSVLVVAFSALTLCTSAFASTNPELFEWSFIGTSDNNANQVLYGGSGTLDATAIGGGQYLVSSISGTVNGQAVSLLPNTMVDTGDPGLSPYTLYQDEYFIWDDVIYKGQGAINNGGIALDGPGLGISAGGVELNLIGDVSQYSWLSELNGAFNFGPLAFTLKNVGSVPEPQTCWMLLGGLVLLVGKCALGKRVLRA